MIILEVNIRTVLWVLHMRISQRQCQRPYWSPVPKAWEGQKPRTSTAACFLCFHASAVSVHPLSLWECEVCVYMGRGREKDRDGKTQAPHTDNQLWIPWRNMFVICLGSYPSSQECKLQSAGVRNFSTQRKRWHHQQPANRTESFRPTANRASWVLLCWRPAGDYSQLQRSDDSWHHHSVRIQPRNPDYQLHQFLGNSSKQNMSRKSYSVNYKSIFKNPRLYIK